MAVSEQDRLLLACPCLNVKMHLAKEPEAGISPVGKELQLGLAGVSVEQKILCSLSISQGLATVRCINCDQDVYTFKPSSTSVILEPTSLAFIASSVLFSPSNGIVVPSDATVSGADIASIRTDPYYSIAFRLVLPPPTNELSTPTTSTPSISSLASYPSQGSQQQQQQQQFPSRSYRPHLEKIRTILDKELESNIAAQQLKTEARIEAYKSQQLNALQKSIEATRLEKERLWAKIQDRVSSPPAASAGSDAGPSPHADGSGFLDPNMATASLHPFDVPSTMPVRFTSASYVQGPQGAFQDRRKASISEAAMSNQFREFEQRMASNSMRRQSIAPTNVPETSSTEPNTITLTNVSLTTAPLADSEAGPSTGDAQYVALSSSHASGEAALSHESESARTSPTPKSKKKVTIVEAISIVEPEGVEDDNIDLEEEDTDEGVVFDLDEELGFGEPEEAVFESDEESDSDLSNEAADHSDVQPLTNGVSAMNISKSLPKHGKGTGEMFVGSLRANYLRRQKNLEHHRRSLKDDLDFENSDDDDDDDDDNDTDNIPAALRFGTSLPIQIQPRPAKLPSSAISGRLPLPQQTTTTNSSSLALPPGSSPAAAMLQRRLSRAYGPDVDSEIGSSTRVGQAGGSSNLSNLSSSLYAGSLRESSILPSLSATPGTVIIDPLMLLEEEHDADDREDQLRKHRQPFSSINHRRDQQELQENTIQFVNENGLNSTESLILGSSSTVPTTIATGAITTTTAAATATTTRSSLRSSSFSAQADFEPPHLYSARTYVGSTPWEMPTRVTVKSGGMQREGSQLDRQIALEMAKEMEKEKQEKAAEAAAAATSQTGGPLSSVDDSPSGRFETARRKVEKIDEMEEEEDEEDAEAKKIRDSLLPPQAVPMPRDQDEERPIG